MDDKALQVGRCDILKVKFDLISYESVMEAIKRWRADGSSHYVTITNPYCVRQCQLDPEVRKATEVADMTLPDGVGVILAARVLGHPHKGRVTGPTLMLRLCDWGRKHGYRHYFYGGAEGVADRLAKRLCKMYPSLEVAGTYCPPFRPFTEEENSKIVEQINSTKPDIVWVGLGSPKQEKWMVVYQDRIKATVRIGVGAAFDFHSGNVKWAPPWVRKLGFEWLYRTMYQPRKGWQRIKGTWSFMVQVFWLKIKRIVKDTP